MQDGDHIRFLKTQKMGGAARDPLHDLRFWVGRHIQKQQPFSDKARSLRLNPRPEFEPLALTLFADVCVDTQLCFAQGRLGA
jgi:hypothetical protein